jgi:ketopantoate reductase
MEADAAAKVSGRAVKRVAGLGAGAMGATFGVALGRAGAEVVFFDVRNVDAINRDGPRLSSPPTPAIVSEWML